MMRSESNLACSFQPVRNVSDPSANSLSVIERFAADLDRVLAAGESNLTDAMTEHLRELLRKNSLEISNTDKPEPRLSFRVWLALVDWAVSPDAAIRRAPNKSELLGPLEFGQRWSPEWPTISLQKHHLVSYACQS